MGGNGRVGTGVPAPDKCPTTEYCVLSPPCTRHWGTEVGRILAAWCSPPTPDPGPDPDPDASRLGGSIGTESFLPFAQASGSPQVWEGVGGDRQTLSVTSGGVLGTVGRQLPGSDPETLPTHASTGHT